MTNPVVDVVAGVTPGRKTLRILPVYPASAKVGLTSWEIGEFVAEALERAGEFADPLPEQWRTSIDLWERTEAFRAIHGPESSTSSRRRGAGWSSTSSSGCNWRSCCAGGPSRTTPAPCTTPCRRAR